MTCALCLAASAVTIIAHDVAGSRELCVRCWLRRAKEDAQWLADSREREELHRAKQAARNARHGPAITANSDSVSELWSDRN